MMTCRIRCQSVDIDGQDSFDIPFRTFLGFKEIRGPDIA